MDFKLAVKRLTNSDLTIFRSQFETLSAGNQKAINLNADVFVDQFYPDIAEFARATRNEVAVALTVFGPAMGAEYPLARKIVGGGVGYKNWRLNGELINDQDGRPGRFDVLKAGDLVVFAFAGAGRPTTIKIVLLAQAAPEDAGIYGALSSFVGQDTRRTMKRIAPGILQQAISDAAADAEHPIRSLLNTWTPDLELEELLLENTTAARKLGRRGVGRSISPEDYRKARERCDATGQAGEALTNAYLSSLVAAGDISSFDWRSSTHAVAPYDFQIANRDGSTTLIDVKCTEGEHSRRFHLSGAEILEASFAQEEYRIYRVSSLKDNGADLQISQPIKAICDQLKQLMEAAPSGVSVDGFTLSPTALQWSPLIRLKADDPAE